MELIARQVIREQEGEGVDRTILDDYTNPDSDRYKKMQDEICKKMGFTSLSYNRLDDMIKSTGLDRSQLCTYCWDGRE